MYKSPFESCANGRKILVREIRLGEKRVCFLDSANWFTFIMLKDHVTTDNEPVLERDWNRPENCSVIGGNSVLLLYETSDATLVVSRLFKLIEEITLLRATCHDHFCPSKIKVKNPKLFLTNSIEKVR